MRVAVGARTDRGMVRENNEDSYTVDLSLQLFVLCDGMGGQAAGEVASKMGVDLVLEHVREAAKNPDLAMVGEYKQEFSRQTNRLASGIRLSNEAIHQTAEEKPSTSGMGSTIVAAQLTGNVLSITHVGDSRIYLLRNGELQQLTQDHSLVMEQVRQGLISLEEAEQSELANVIIRALGAEPDVVADMDELWVSEGDQILLCSDGLTRMVSDPAIAQILQETETAQQASDRLVEIANDNGGEDNVTVIVVRLDAPPSLGRWKKLLKFLFGGNRAWPN